MNIENWKSRLREPWFYIDVKSFLANQTLHVNYSLKEVYGVLHLLLLNFASGAAYDDAYDGAASGADYDGAADDFVFAWSL